MKTLYLVHLARKHVGDDLFLKSLAQSLAGGEGGAPACVFVHGSGEKVERTLEAQGIFPDRTDGVLEVEGEEQRQLVERALREVNQEIVGVLTDEVVSAVGIQGVDRNLLERADRGPVRATNVGWLAALIKQRVVPVVSALVGSERPMEVRGDEVVVALARALSSSFEPVACVFTTNEQPGLSGGEGLRSSAPIDAVTEENVPDPSLVERIARGGIPILISNLQGLLKGEPVRGTTIEPSSQPAAQDTEGAS